MKSALCILFSIIILLPLKAQDPTRFQAEIDAIEDKEYLIDARKETVVFTGSSSVRMWTDIQEYYPEVNAINTGFGGSEFSDLIHYREELIFSLNPDKIFIYEGDNDVNSGKEPMEIAKDAEELITLIRDEYPEIPIFLISPKPSIARWELKAEYEKTNELLKSLAMSKEDVEFIDVWNPMLNEDGEPFDDIFIEDNLHMNEKGYKIWGEVIGNYLK